jgi:hypothetical protein
MITQVAKLTWEADRLAPRTLLPRLAAEVAAAGGQFLVFKGSYIDAAKAEEHLRSVMLHLARAEESLRRNQQNAFPRPPAADALEDAGRAWAYYLGALQVLDWLEEFPGPLVNLVDHPNYIDHWKKGVLEIASQCTTRDW